MNKIEAGITIMFVGAILYFVSPTLGAGIFGVGAGFLIKN